MSLVLEGSSSQVMFGYTDRISHIGVIDTAELIAMAPFDDGRSAPHRTDVIRYWRESRKFGVVDPLTGTTSECDLTGDATKMIAARFEAETGRPKPRGYVACRGALSEAFMDGALATHLPWSGLQAA